MSEIKNKTFIADQLSISKKVAYAFSIFLFFLFETSSAFAFSTSGGRVTVSGGSKLINLGFLNSILEFMQGPLSIIVVVLALIVVCFRNMGGHGGGWLMDSLKFGIPAILIVNIGKILTAIGITGALF